LSYVQNVNSIIKTSQSKPILTMMQFKFFVGIDVSKDTLDFSVVTEGKEILAFKIENSLRAIKAALLSLKKIKGYELSQVVFCLEYTGLYNNHITHYLHSIGAHIWVEKAIQIKRSSGLQRGKSDTVDAQRIAFYASRNQDRARLWVAPRTVIQQLKRLTGVRERLLIMVAQLNKPLQESKRFDSKEVFDVIKKSCQSSLRAIRTDLKKVEKKITEVIKADASLSHLFELITSVDGIGSVIACEMILTTNEFKNITDPKKYACYAGVVPFEHTSGSSVKGRSRVSHFANKNTKRLLHMAALSIIRYQGELKTYWLRKIQEGKHKMIILNAIRNKLIQRVFAVVKRGTKYERIYSHSLQGS
jgi:transposase